VTHQAIRYDTIDPAIEARAAELLGRMTLAEKIGQLVQPAPYVAVVPQAPSQPTEQPGVTDEAARPEWQPRQGLDELIPHGVAGDLKDAARLSLLAGVDIEMVSQAYSKHLAELVAEGTLRENPESHIESSRRKSNPEYLTPRPDGLIMRISNPF